MKNKGFLNGTAGARSICQVLCGLLVASATPAQDKLAEIPWAVVDWAPMMVLKDGKAPATAADLGEGGIDRAMAEMIKRLGGYQHTFRLMNRQRIWKSFERGENLCYASAFKTPEREKLAVFSPAIALPPIAVVVRKGDHARIAGVNRLISLKDLIRNPAWVGRLEDGRAYGPVLDKVLADATPPVPREIVATTGALVRLLALGRFDYTLEYPMVVRYFDALSPADADLEVVPLSEGLEWPVLYVACTRNTWGQAVIRDVDAAIRKAAGSPEFRGVFNRWLQADYVERNRAHVNAFYEGRAKTQYPPD